MSYTVIGGKPGARLRLGFTEEDKLWLCRMIVGERTSRVIHRTDECAVLLWCMANRYLLHPGRKFWPTFLIMLRGFSQPINPRWMRGGDLARKYAGRPEASEARLKRRETVSSMPLEKIPLKIIRDVGLFCSGDLPLPAIPVSRPSDWASYKGVDTKFPGGFWCYGNWVFSNRGLNKGTVMWSDSDA